MINFIKIWIFHYRDYLNSHFLSGWINLVKTSFLRENSNSKFWILKKKVACIGVNTWEAGDYSEQQYMVLNGAWDSNWDEVEEARKGLGEVIDNLLCSEVTVEF